MPSFYSLLLSGSLLLAACQPATPDALLPGAASTVSGDPPACDCCVFDEQHPTTWHTRLAPDTAAGQPLRISGTVYESDGQTPAANTLMYFYHTNSRGRYAKIGTEPRTSHAWWHGYCRGWLKTDARGRYSFRTIRPAPYPGKKIPAHIHFYVKAPSQRQCYYLSDFVFADDPLLTDTYWSDLEQAEGFPRYDGVTLTKVGDTLIGQRDIYLLPQYDRVPTQSGLRVGQDCPSFQPTHAWGPDQGKQTCPMCAYGGGEGVLIWTRSLTSDTLMSTARFWEQALQHRGSRPLRAFILYTNPAGEPAAAVRQRLEQFARQAELREVAVAWVPSPDDKATAALYQINPAVSITIIGYKQRQTVSNSVNPAADNASLRAQLKALQ